LHVGPPTLPIAVASVCLDSSDIAAAAAVPGITQEFFGPCVVLARVSHSQDLSGDTRVTLDALSKRSQQEAEPTEAEVSTTEMQALTDLRKAFLDVAVPLVNKHAFGNLVVSIYAPDASAGLRPSEIQKAVDALEYGSVVVNDLTFLPYFTQRGVWGGFQDKDTSIMNPRSGVGFVRNGLLFDDVEKAVLWQSFQCNTSSLDAPLPPFVGKLLAGALAGGASGVWQALWA
jgi:hypothetical protein